MKVNILLSLLFIVMSFLVSCEKESSSIVLSDNNDLAKLEIKYIDGIGYSNLMPPNSPDPVGIIIRLELTNKSISDTIFEIDFENCNVFLTTDSLLGEIELEPWYDIKLIPSSVDTVTLGKVKESSKIFDTPCGNDIYLTFDIIDKYNNFLNLKTDIISYECDY